MRVTVEFFGDLPKKLGKRRDVFECDCKSAEDLRDVLLERYPELRKAEEEYKESGVGLVILVNGRDVRHLKIIEDENVEVSVFPPAAGG